MGGGGGPAVMGAVVAPADDQRAMADLARVAAWKCGVKGCTDEAKNGVTLKYIARHRKTHREEQAKQQAKEAMKKAIQEQKVRAAGPSAQRRKNRLKDMAAQQRAASKKGATTTTTTTKAKGKKGKPSGGGRKGKAPRQ